MDKCTVPPIDWECTRPAGHDGPCAAVPADGIGVDWNPDYTPTTDAVCNVYAYIGQGFAPSARKTNVQGRAEFYRWLIAHDDEVAAKALAAHHESPTPTVPGFYVRRAIPSEVYRLETVTYDDHVAYSWEWWCPGSNRPAVRVPLEEMRHIAAIGDLVLMGPVS